MPSMRAWLRYQHADHGWPPPIRNALLAVILTGTGFVTGSLWGHHAEAQNAKPKKPLCCCVGDGTGHYVCEPNKGECECGCPEKNCKLLD